MSVRVNVQALNPQSLGFEGRSRISQLKPERYRSYLDGYGLRATT